MNRDELSIVLEVQELCRNAEASSDSGDNEAALSHAKTALDIAETYLGKSHEAYPACLNTLGNIYFNSGNNYKALPFLEAAEKIYQNAGTTGNQKYIDLCHYLAVVYMNMADYELAEELFLRANFITGRIFGKNNKGYYFRCFNLGQLHHEYLQDDNKAEPYWLEAKK